MGGALHRGARPVASLWPAGRTHPADLGSARSERRRDRGCPARRRGRSHGGRARAVDRRARRRARHIRARCDKLRHVDRQCRSRARERARHRRMSAGTAGQHGPAAGNAARADPATRDAPFADAANRRAGVARARSRRRLRSRRRKPAGSRVCRDPDRRAACDDCASGGAAGIPCATSDPAPNAGSRGDRAGGSAAARCEAPACHQRAGRDRRCAGI